MGVYKEYVEAFSNSKLKLLGEINGYPLTNGSKPYRFVSIERTCSYPFIHGIATIAVTVPLHKEPDWLWNTIDRWLRTCETKSFKEAPQHVKDLLEVHDLKTERDWLKTRLEAENCPVVFCHNDMQEGNILISRDADREDRTDEPDIVIIDFEYCSYNYRSFDIANHFVEWAYDYTEPAHPFYKEDWSNYPTEQQRMAFIRAYLDEVGSRENPKKVMREVEVFSLASHLFWSVWGLINADTSQIPFGYWEYAYSRLSCYFQLKQRLSGNAQLKRKMDDLSV